MQLLSNPGLCTSHQAFVSGSKGLGNVATPQQCDDGVRKNGGLHINVIVFVPVRNIWSSLCWSSCNSQIFNSVMFRSIFVESHLNQTVNLGSTGVSWLMPLSKAWLSINWT
jgi:hypothetical protein